MTNMVALAPAAHAVSPGVHIQCTLDVRLTFNPAITNSLQVVSASASGWLGNKASTEPVGIPGGTTGSCTSPDGTAKDSGGTLIAGSSGSTYPNSGAGGSGSATGPNSCTSSNLPNGTGQITWNDNTQIKFNWQFGVTASGATFTGQVTSSTASWSAPGDSFVVQLTGWTQNGGSGAGKFPIVSCFLPGGVTQDDFAADFELETPPPNPAPTITVNPGTCSVSGANVTWTDTVTGLNFPASTAVQLIDTGFDTGTQNGTNTVIAAGLDPVTASVTTSSSGTFSTTIPIKVNLGLAQPPGTIEQNADSVLASTPPAVAAGHGGPNYCVAKP
ncbi:hypothetical protein [Streptomyces natalensis]|nr:hypothetical protein [Streptomyces natalensis]